MVGRPRKPGARKPSGRLQYKVEVDLGPREARAQRAVIADPSARKRLIARGLAGVELVEALAALDIPGSKAPNDALDFLAKRGLFTSAERYAGRRYASLFARAVRPVTLTCLLGGLVSRAGVSVSGAIIDDVARDDADGRAGYLAARAVLQRRGPRVAKAVDELVVFGQVPRSTARLELARDGLQALKRHFDESRH